MRRLLPILLLLILAYIGWYYWQRLADRPLEIAVLGLRAEEITRITAGPAGEAPQLELSRTDDGWVVAQPPRQLYDQSVRAASLVERLAELRSDSLCRRPPAGPGTRVVVYGGPGRQRELVFYPATTSTPLVRVTAADDVYHLPPDAGRYLLPALAFDHYRERRLLDLLPGRVDSLVARRGDSTLWVVDSGLAPLSDRLLAPAAAPFADHFDEIAHRDRYHADLHFYHAGRSHRVRAYRDSLWPQPYVLVGDDYPRRYFSFDRIR